MDGVVWPNPDPGVKVKEKVSGGGGDSGVGDSGVGGGAVEELVCCVAGE